MEIYLPQLLDPTITGSLHTTGSAFITGSVQVTGQIVSPKLKLTNVDSNPSNTQFLTLNVNGVVEKTTIGTSGVGGTSGTSGQTGSSGTSGQTGSSGTSGQTGSSGTSGQTGSSGTSGQTGSSGTSGANGANGSSGTSGQTGSSGTSGANGANGSSGTSGASVAVSGTQNTIVKFTSPTTIGNTTTPIFENGTNIGVGTTSPSAIFHVSGSNATSIIDGVRIGRGSGDRSTNTVVGNDALTSNTTGQFNNAFGYRALKYNTTGVSNNAFGAYALSNNTSGINNTSFGFLALRYNTRGFNNNAMGSGTLNRNTTGANNNAFGYGALYNNTTGTNNVGFGTTTLYNNSVGSSNNAMGVSALINNTTSNNNAFGTFALSSNTTGARNSAFGHQSIKNNTFGIQNSAFGYRSLSSNTTGINNSAFGSYALNRNTTGTTNNAFGHRSLFANTIGSSNCAFGTQALNSNTTGANNTAFGTLALSSNTIGSNNIAIGYQTGDSITTGNNNIIIGHNIDVPVATGNNQLNIANLIFASGSAFGQSTQTSTGSFVGIGTNRPSAKLHIVGGAQILNTSGSTTATTSGSLMIVGQNTKGGINYHDFLYTKNSKATLNPNKFFRQDDTGNLEIINSSYGTNIFTLTDSGSLVLPTAQSRNVVQLRNSGAGLKVGNYGLFFDDGNVHLHSTSPGTNIWLNCSGSGMFVVNGQSGATNGMCVGTSIQSGFVTIVGSKSVSITQPYGYLISSGAGSTIGTSPNPYSLTCDSRIMSSEFNAPSDERLKNIRGEISLDKAIDFVTKVDPIEFTWKEGVDTGLKAGYSAQQTYKAGFEHLIGVVPKQGIPEVIEPDGFISPKDAQFVMNYEQVTPYHSKLIKHMLAKIEQLEEKIKQLETPLNQ